MAAAQAANVSCLDILGGRRGEVLLAVVEGVLHRRGRRAPGAGRGSEPAHSTPRPAARLREVSDASVRVLPDGAAASSPVSRLMNVVLLAPLVRVTAMRDESVTLSVTSLSVFLGAPWRRGGESEREGEARTISSLTQQLNFTG